MRMPFRLNPHRSRTLPAVSFFEGFQTPAGLEKTRAHLCGRHLKPISKAAVPDFSRSHARQGSFGILIVWTGGVLQEETSQRGALGLAPLYQTYLWSVLQCSWPSWI